ncbi:MAG: GNAT family N-acetyltransferase [Steroidobacteraceae bacterium]
MVTASMGAKKSSGAVAFLARPEGHAYHRYVSHGMKIKRLERLGEPQISGLAAVLSECVQAGASVSFMLPMSREKAADYWRSVAGAVERGECLVFAAVAGLGEIVGTVTLALKQPENQPHRADVAKMLVHPRGRRQGVGALLLAAAEEAALAAGKTLLVLDTASEEAARLYTRAGWQHVGVIPDYALWPGGGLCPTTVFYKRLKSALA